jgi:hypothetical protein
VVDEAVRDDGTVDLSVLSAGTSTAPGARTTGPITPTYFGPAMVDAAVKVVALCMAAFTAGYAVGKEIGEALDDDESDEGAEGEGHEGNGGGDDGGGDGGDDGGGDGGGSHATEQSHIVLEPLDKGRVSVRVGEAPVMTHAVPVNQMTVQQFLARLKADREGMVRELTRNRNWRIVSAPIGSGITAVVDGAVRPDGSIDLAALDTQPPADVHAMGPLGWAIAAVAGAVVTSFVVGVAVGLAVETLGDDDTEGEGEGEGEGDDTGGTSDTGGGGGDTGGGGSGGASTKRNVVGVVLPGPHDDVVLSVRTAT